MIITGTKTENTIFEIITFMFNNIEIHSPNKIIKGLDSDIKDNNTEAGLVALVNKVKSALKELELMVVLNKRTSFLKPNLTVEIYDVYKAVKKIIQDKARFYSRSTKATPYPPTVVPSTTNNETDLSNMNTAELKDYIDRMIVEGLTEIIHKSDTIIGSSFMTLSINKTGLYLRKNDDFNKVRLHIPFAPPLNLVGYKANIRGWDEVSVVYNN